MNLRVSDCTLLLILPLLVTGAGAQPVASAWESSMASAVKAFEQKNFVESDRFMARAKKEAEHFSPNDPRVGSTYNTSGLIYMANDRPKEAEPNFRRAVTVFEASYGDKSLDVGNVLYNLSDSLRQQGRYDAVEPYLKRVLVVYLAVLGKDSPKVAQVYFWLGDTERHLHNYAAAEIDLKRAAELREASNGMQSTDLAAALNSLALCYAAESKYGQAEPLFKLSLNIREAKYGLNHREVLESLENYAAMLRETGRVKDAEKMTTLAGVIRSNLRNSK